MLAPPAHGLLRTFGIYESDIHDLERSADEHENAYASSHWMKEERAQFATRVRGLKARGRAALRAEKQAPEGASLEPVDHTIERLGAAFDLLMRWLELLARLHPDVKDGVEKLARTMRRDLKFRMKLGLDPIREARELLGIEEDATEETIRETWRIMMHRTHPGRGGSAPLFRMVREAGELLLSEKGRTGESANK